MKSILEFNKLVELFALALARDKIMREHIVLIKTAIFYIADKLNLMDIDSKLIEIEANERLNIIEMMLNGRY